MTSLTSGLVRRSGSAGGGRWLREGSQRAGGSPEARPSSFSPHLPLLSPFPFPSTALAGIALFILVKGKAIFWLRDREVDRILDLAPSERHLLNCYKLSRVIFLATLITSFKVIEIYTDEYYSSRLTFSASAIAVGIMLSAACVSTLFRLFSDKLLGVEDVGEYWVEKQGRHHQRYTWRQEKWYLHMWRQGKRNLHRWR
jgi:hypothetical protein